MQIIVYTSDFSNFINKLSKIMIKSNAKSLFDTIATLYKDTASSRHDVQNVLKHTAIFFLYRGKIQILSSLLC